MDLFGYYNSDKNQPSALTNQLPPLRLPEDMDNTPHLANHQAGFPNVAVYTPVSGQAYSWTGNPLLEFVGLG